MDRTIGGVREGFQLVIKADGNYVTVYPEDKDRPVISVAVLKDRLAEEGVINYDDIQLARLVRAADGFEVKLNPASDDEGGNEVIPFSIEIARDAMTAAIRFDEKHGNLPPDVTDVLNALAAKKVIYGIDREAIGRGVARLTPFMAARGTQPEAGTDARIEKKFDMGTKGRPAERAYDRVDYKDMNIFIRAQIGDVLAVRIPETAGVSGKNVFGEEVPARPGKPAVLPQGKNTKIVNEHELVALIDGQIADDGKKISVDPHLVIDSSVDVGTGNIDFAGSVEIKGDVESGFTVKAAGDVEIKGMIGGAQVEGRNVIVHGGIRGMNIGKISATEDVSISFVENANISAGRDIYVNDVVLHSEMRAGHHVRVEGRRGVITGGSIGAGESILAKTYGNNFYVQTNLHVGVDPNLKHRYEALSKECEMAVKRLTEMRLSLETLKKQPLMSLSERRREQLVEMTHAQFPLAGKVKEMQEELQRMNEELEQMKNGVILASETIYPGVNVTINGVKKSIEGELHHARLQMIDGEIAVGIF
ncbi:hypothetical protein HMPREF1992_00535 [Selenomonas sp. oral taxon 892 str. F0426]|uniref:DUF342 domain-containing protein n=1 Tax=Selenomonas sp. oral taxon 892 TaxID=1321785 RepID=UPI0003ACFC8E|nr:FapA family protein [Selenomonas sp. oral taxon 892]ERJ95292.1 hypothetical protein HMPREF1992_00535 [Selenomonas sp. oral taxon 892 str. F0426]